jgi:hypothetical protein
MCSSASFEQLDLEHFPEELISNLALELRLAIAGPTLQFESSIQLHQDGVSYVAVECLTPHSRVWSDPRGQSAPVVQILDPELQSPKLEVLGESLVRDILKDNAADRLLEACRRRPWLISREDLNVWFPV